MKNIEEYDLIVIGGGPAGMMAAGTAALNGASVLLLEKNPENGRKLLLSGSGRCNITNAKSEIREFIVNFGKNGRFLYSALNNFSVEDTINFFNANGVGTIVEHNNKSKIFPKSDKASDILKALEIFMENNGVEVINNSKVNSFETENGKITSLNLKDRNLKSKSYIIATGGLSYPATGSTGDGYNWAKIMGHDIVETRPVLVPILIQEKWIRDIMGISLKDVSLSIYENNKKISFATGDLIITHDGFSGPAIYELSRKTKISTNNVYTLQIDLLPELPRNDLDLNLQKIIETNGKKKIKNCIEGILTERLVSKILSLSKIDENKTAANLTKTERKQIIQRIKEFTFTIKDFAGYNRAVITAGGVQLKQIDSKTMQSKKIENLFFAGEIIDLDGTTGGYNLQLCWSTGYMAGLSAARYTQL